MCTAARQQGCFGFRENSFCLLLLVRRKEPGLSLLAQVEFAELGRWHAEQLFYHAKYVHFTVILYSDLPSLYLVCFLDLLHSIIIYVRLSSVKQELSALCVLYSA